MKTWRSLARALPYYLRHEAVALELLPMEAQLSLKAALPLAGILATASDRCRKTGPLQTPASPGAVHQRARRMYVWSAAQQRDSRANKCDVTIGNDMTSQSRKDLRQCVLSHWRFIQLSQRIVIISHWMLLHNSWTVYVYANPSIYLRVYAVYFPRNGRTRLNVRIFVP